MSKELIKIADFSMFYDTVRSLSKLVSAAKFTVNSEGMQVLGRNTVSRCVVRTDAITSDGEVEFCIGDLGVMMKVLTTVKDVHESDYSELKFFYSAPFIHFESKKLKTKISTKEESIIKNFIDKPIQTTLVPVVGFTTTSQAIKTLNSHSFMFSNSDDVRISLRREKDMENNALFATLAVPGNTLANSITTKFGLINFGDLGDRSLILNFTRVNLFNIVQSDEIKIELMDKNALVYRISDTSGDCSSSITIYVSLMSDG